MGAHCSCEPLCPTCRRRAMRTNHISNAIRRRRMAVDELVCPFCYLLNDCRRRVPGEDRGVSKRLVISTTWNGSSETLVEEHDTPSSKRDDTPLSSAQQQFDSTDVHSRFPRQRMPSGRTLNASVTSTSTSQAGTRGSTPRSLATISSGESTNDFSLDSSSTASPGDQTPDDHARDLRDEPGYSDHIIASPDGEDVNAPKPSKATEHRESMRGGDGSHQSWRRARSMGSPGSEPEIEDEDDVPTELFWHRTFRRENLGDSDERREGLRYTVGELLARRRQRRVPSLSSLPELDLPGPSLGLEHLAPIVEDPVQFDLQRTLRRLRSRSFHGRELPPPNYALYRTFSAGGPLESPLTRFTLRVSRTPLPTRWTAHVLGILAGILAARDRSALSRAGDAQDIPTTVVLAALLDRGTSGFPRNTIARFSENRAIAARIIDLATNRDLDADQEQSEEQSEDQSEDDSGGPSEDQSGNEDQGQNGNQEQSGIHDQDFLVFPLLDFDSISPTSTQDWYWSRRGESPPTPLEVFQNRGFLHPTWDTPSSDDDEEDLTLVSSIHGPRHNSMDWYRTDDRIRRMTTQNARTLAVLDTLEERLGNLRDDIGVETDDSSNVSDSGEGSVGETAVERDGRSNDSNAAADDAEMNGAITAEAVEEVNGADADEIGEETNDADAADGEEDNDSNDDPDSDWVGMEDSVVDSAEDDEEEREADSDEAVNELSAIASVVELNDEHESILATHMQPLELPGPGDVEMAIEHEPMPGPAEEAEGMGGHTITPEGTALPAHQEDPDVVQSAEDVIEVDVSELMAASGSFRRHFDDLRRQAGGPDEFEVDLGLVQLPPRIDDNHGYGQFQERPLIFSLTLANTVAVLWQCGVRNIHLIYYILMLRSRPRSRSHGGYTTLNAANIEVLATCLRYSGISDTEFDATPLTPGEEDAFWRMQDQHLQAESDPEEVGRRLARIRRDPTL